MMIDAVPGYVRVYREVFGCTRICQAIPGCAGIYVVIDSVDVDDDVDVNDDVDEDVDVLGYARMC